MSNNDFAVFDYQTVFVSDFHLGSNKTASPYLYEFLSHIDYTKLKELYLVGDVVGGWEHQNNTQQPLPEMERRILDIINYAADRGVKVHFIPGNHDEKLRPVLPVLQNRKSFDTFHENIIFENSRFYDTAGPDTKRLKVLHGDQYDPTSFVKPWFRPIAKAGSWLYDKLVVLNAKVSKNLYRAFGIDVSFAKVIQDIYQKSVNSSFSHQALMNGLDTTEYDGILMGHTHISNSEEFKKKGRSSYLINIGDWVESSTFGYVDAAGGLPKVVSYKEEREDRGFGNLPDEQDEHPAQFAAYRDRTNAQVRMLHMMWPAKNRDDVFKDYFDAERKIRSFREDRELLQNIFKELSDTGQLKSRARKGLSAVLHSTKFNTYKPQKVGLRLIFNRYASNEQIVGRDVLFTKTILREFMSRCDRKIKLYEKERRKQMVRLDAQAPTVKQPQP